MCTERRLLPPAAAADSCTFRVANEPENFPICQNPKVPPPSTSLMVRIQFDINDIGWSCSRGDAAYCAMQCGPAICSSEGCPRVLPEDSVNHLLGKWRTWSGEERATSGNFHYHTRFIITGEE